MNKSELISAALVASPDVTKKQAEDIVDATLDAIIESVAKEEKVTIYGFGTFDIRKRKAREGRNPQTGEKMQIPASKTVGFKPLKAFKDALK